jgi:hypothetical protein
MNVAWSLIGPAVGQAYSLHLERYSFREEAKDENKLDFHRNRLAWICKERCRILFITANVSSHVSRRPSDLDTNGAGILVSRAWFVHSVYDR